MIKNRRSRRSPVLLAASIEVGGTSLKVKLRNLSEEGALIEGERLPEEERLMPIPGVIAGGCVIGNQKFVIDQLSSEVGI